MSVHPVLAAFAGLVILHQVPAVHEAVGIGIVVGANIVAVSTLRPARSRETVPTPASSV